MNHEEGQAARFLKVTQCLEESNASDEGMSKVLRWTRCLRQAVAGDAFRLHSGRALDIGGEAFRSGVNEGLLGQCLRVNEIIGRVPNRCKRKFEHCV